MGPIQQLSGARAIDAVGRVEALAPRPFDAGVDDVAARVRALVTNDALVAKNGQAAVATSARDGELDRLAAGAVEGKPAGERRDLYVDLAKSLDGQGLATLTVALANGGDARRVEELGDAIATHGGPRAKLDYLRALGAATLRPATGDAARPADTALSVGELRAGDPVAGAVGVVLGSMRGSLAEAAFAALLTPGAGGEAPLRGLLESWGERVSDGVARAADSVRSPEIGARVAEARANAGAVRDGGDLVGVAVGSGRGAG